MANLPNFLPFPAAEVRNQIPLDLWQVCVDSWTVLLKARLLLSDAAFEKHLFGQGDNLIEFLGGLAKELAYYAPAKHDAHIQSSFMLGRHGVVLAHRCLTQTKERPPRLLNWQFLAQICKAGGDAEHITITQIWTRNEETYQSSLQDFKSSFVTRLDKGRTNSRDWEDVNNLAVLMHKVPAVAESVITSSDLIDTITSSYASLGPDARSSAIVMTYLGLTSLLADASQRLSVVNDVLYGMITPAETHGSQQLKHEIFMQDLASKTPLISRLRRLASTSANTRLQKVLEKLTRFYVKEKARPPSAQQRARRENAKGKAIATTNGNSDSHMHDLTLITQIQDLFPDLGSAYIAKLMDHYGEDAELITSHLLEDELPSELRGLDRTANIEQNGHAEHSTLEATPSSPKRKNVFDDDAFDRLAADTSRIHLGRRDQDATADDLLGSKTDRPSTKAAVLSALAAFDADDDERDDTYDIADVGGTVDAVKPDGMEDTDEARQSFETALFAHWQANPALFARDAATRRSQPRLALRKETGMTDEAIEGWSVMIQRDPRRLRAIEARASLNHGNQRALASTSWRASAGAESDAEEAEEASGNERGGLMARGRGGGGGGGRGRGGRGRGDVAGATGERTTQVARDRKEKGKSSRANHNRKSQRARKTARAGFAE